MLIAKIPSNINVFRDFGWLKEAYQGNITTGEGFEALWPGKFSLEELQKRLREEGWPHFSAQYLNNPVPEETATFKRHWFQYYGIEDLRGRLLNKFLTIYKLYCQL